MREHHLELTRKIHLDFHNPHWVREIGRRFDGDAFAEELKAARVRAVTLVFGLCANGNAYYPSKLGKVHPGLDRDLAGAAIEALRRHGLGVYVHFTVAINDRAVIENPDWAMVSRDGKRYDTNGATEWGWPCFNSPYIEEWVWPHLEEFLGMYEVDGVFLDMVAFPVNCCFCERCRKEMSRRGLNPEDYRDHERFEHEVLDAFVREAYRRVKAIQPRAAFTCNHQVWVGGMRRRLPYLDSIEFEAPVSWCSYFFAVMARYLRTLPIPASGMSTRFLRNWGYFGTFNPPAQLKFECAEMLATLGNCNIGDQMLPTGELEPEAYRAIGEAFAFAEEREPWTLGAKSVPYIGLLSDDQRGNRVMRTVYGGKLPDGFIAHQEPAAFFGIGKAFLESSEHFDVLDAASDFDGYRLLVLAENKTLDEAVIPRLRSFVEQGGALLGIGGELWKNPAWRSFLEEATGSLYRGEGSYRAEFIRPREPLIAAGALDAPLFVGGRLVRVEPGPETEVAATVHHPYEGLDRPLKFSHFHAPPADEAAEYPGVVLHRFGLGRTAWITGPLASEYLNNQNPGVRRLIRAVARMLIPGKERVVEVEQASPLLEISLMAQEKRWVLHLIHYTANRSSAGQGAGSSMELVPTGSTVIEEIPEMAVGPVRVKLPFTPRRVVEEPKGRELDFRIEDGAVQVTPPPFGIHTMIVFEM